jgi:uncharacterized protein
MIRLLALLCGMACGAGVMISGLVQPAAASGPAAAVWDWAIALGVAMLSALGVAALVLGLTSHLHRPFPEDRRAAFPAESLSGTIVGGLLFGLGWGVAGYVPLAALVALGHYAPGAAVFLVAVLVGMILHDLVTKGGLSRGDGARPWG